jgi:TonB-dependent receptor
MKARAEGSYNELRETWSPKVSFAGSNIFDLDSGRRLGLAGAISWNDRELHVDNNELDDWDVAPNGSDFSEEFEPRLYTIERERIGGVLNLDLDVSDTTRLYAYTLYSRFTDTELRNATTFAIEDVVEATVTATHASYDTVEIERDTKGRNIRGQTAENMSISLGSETQLDTWLIETNFGYAYARERTPDQVDGAWVAEFESGDGPITAGSPVLTLDRTNPQIPVVNSDFWSALMDPTLYELDKIENSHEKNEDTQFTLALDFGRETGFGSVKFGVKARLREKKTNEDAEVWENDDTWFLHDALLPNGGAAYGFPTPMDPVPDNSIERSILADQIGIEFEALDSQIDSNVADFVFDEDVYAVYAMGTWETGRATINVGIRAEFTELDNRGNIVELVEEDGDDPNTGIPVTEDTVFVTPIAATNSYSDVLPSANLRFEFNHQLIGRASVFRSVVRPRVEQVAFRVEIDDGEAEIGNPDLDPFRAWNLDASIAYYPTDLSVISAGVFYKRIEDFIFVQEIDDFEFAGRTFDPAVIALNGEDATVVGVELNYQQHFGFLNSPWDAFLIGMNYTYVDSEADTGSREIALPKQSANIANVVLGYDKHGFDLRIAMKYRDRYIDELVEPGLDRYTDDHLQWDITAKYRFSDSWQVYAEIMNIGDEPEFYYAGIPNRTLQYDEFGTTSAIGIQYNFSE